MSDPSAINLPIHTALTSDMMLGLKPSAPKSRSYRISIAPMNKSTFSGGDQMILNFLQAEGVHGMIHLNLI